MVWHADVTLFAAAYGTAQSRPAPDFTGAWRLDRTLSGSSRNPIGERWTESTWGGVKAEHSAAAIAGQGRHPAVTSSRAWKGLPELMKVGAPAGDIEVKDSRDALIETIVTTAGGDIAPTDVNGIRQVRGTWRGEDLQVEVLRPDGVKLTQTWTLIDGGRSLKITNHLDRPGRPVECARVYRRIS